MAFFSDDKRPQPEHIRIAPPRVPIRDLGTGAGRRHALAVAFAMFKGRLAARATFSGFDALEPFTGAVRPSGVRGPRSISQSVVADIMLPSIPIPIPTPVSRWEPVTPVSASSLPTRHRASILGSGRGSATRCRPAHGADVSAAQRPDDRRRQRSASRSGRRRPGREVGEQPAAAAQRLTANGGAAHARLRSADRGAAVRRSCGDPWTVRSIAHGPVISVCAPKRCMVRRAPSRRKWTSLKAG